VDTSSFYLSTLIKVSVLIKPQQLLSSGTGRVSLHDREGTEVVSIQGKGEVVHTTYWALFEAACKARDRAVKGSSYIVVTNLFILSNRADCVMMRIVVS
jgi:hypothetical protein